MKFSMIRTDLPRLLVLDDAPVHRRAPGRLAGKTGDAGTCAASHADADTPAPEQSFECIAVTCELPKPLHVTRLCEVRDQIAAGAPTFVAEVDV